jgi:hypothetical protein
MGLVFSLATIDVRLLLRKSTSPPPRDRLGLALAAAFNEVVEFDIILLLFTESLPLRDDEFDFREDRAERSSRLPRLSLDEDDDDVDLSFLLEPLLFIDWASASTLWLSELIDCCFSPFCCCLFFDFGFDENVMLTSGAANADEGLILGSL